MRSAAGYNRSIRSHLKNSRVPWLRGIRIVTLPVGDAAVAEDERGADGVDEGAVVADEDDGAFEFGEGFLRGFDISSRWLVGSSRMRTLAS